jgi:diaminopimelate epimerase
MGDVLLPLECFEHLLNDDQVVARGTAVPFVLNKLLFPRKGSIKMTSAALKATTSAHEFNEMTFKVEHIRMVLSNHSIQMTSVDIHQLETRSRSTYVVFCRLNPNFVSKKYSSCKQNPHHVVMIRNGFIHCVYLREHNRPVKLSVHKHLFITSDEYDTDNTRNSYISHIKMAYIVSSLNPHKM